MKYRANRTRIHAKAILVADGERIGTHILDLSRDGARIQVPFTLPAGTAAYLKVGPNDFAALVQWCHSGHAGLRFLARLDRDTLLRLEGTCTERAPNE